jgi:Zn-dependent protease
LPGPQVLFIVIILLAVLIASLSVHEAAHAWTADRLGDPTARMLGRLTLNPLAHIDWIGTVAFPLIAFFTNFPLIGWAKPVPVLASNLKSPRRDFALVALAGPTSNIGLAVGFALLLWPLEQGSTFGPSGSSLVASILRHAVELNVFLAIFNLIPVPPLDGGNVLVGLAPEPVANLVDRLRPFGILILYALLFTGALWTVVAPLGDLIAGWLLP